MQYVDELIIEDGLAPRTDFLQPPFSSREGEVLAAAVDRLRVAELERSAEVPPPVPEGVRRLVDAGRVECAGCHRRDGIEFVRPWRHLHDTFRCRFCLAWHQRPEESSWTAAAPPTSDRWLRPGVAQRHATVRYREDTRVPGGGEDDPARRSPTQCRGCFEDGSLIVVAPWRRGFTTFRCVACLIWRQYRRGRPPSSGASGDTGGD